MKMSNKHGDDTILLNPLKNRKDMDPDSAFIHSLSKIILQDNKKKKTVAIRLILITTTAAFLFSIFMYNLLQTDKSPSIANHSIKQKIDSYNINQLLEKNPNYKNMFKAIADKTNKEYGKTIIFYLEALKNKDVSTLKKLAFNPKNTQDLISYYNKVDFTTMKITKIISNESDSLQVIFHFKYKGKKAYTHLINLNKNDAGIFVIDLLKSTMKAGKNNVDIVGTDKIVPILKFPYGNATNEVGIKPDGREGDIGTGPTSFFVQNNIFYILDNVNKRILISNKNGSTSTISLMNNMWLEDIYVDNEKMIYVLDTANRKVQKLTVQGNVISEYSIPDSINIPTGLTLNSEKQIIVNQSQDFSANLSTGELYSNRVTNVEGQKIKEQRLNEKEGLLSIEDDGKTIEISIDFEESFGGLTVNSIKPNQIIFTQTEVASDIPVIMAEMHMYVIDRKGKFLGGARIPLEKMRFSPEHLINVDNNKVYLLSPEKKNLVIYEIKPGVIYMQNLQERMNAFKAEN